MDDERIERLIPVVRAIYEELPEDVSDRGLEKMDQAVSQVLSALGVDVGRFTEAYVAAAERRGPRG